MNKYISTKLPYKHIHSKSFLIFLPLLTALFLSTCDKPEKLELKVLRVGGSTSIFPVAHAAAKIFKKSHPEVKIEVTATSTGKGIRGLIAGKQEIATASRSPKEKEFETAKKNGVILKVFQIAYDALAIVVHPSKYDTARSLTHAQVRDIFFNGKITNWSQIDSSLSGTIQVYVRDQKDSGAAETFTAHITGAEDTPYVKHAKYQKITTDMVPAVANDPNGIAFAPYSFVSKTVRAVAFGESTDSLVEANFTNIRNRNYTLRRDLFLVTNGPPSGMTSAYIQFILSKTGQQIVNDKNLISLR